MKRLIVPLLLSAGLLAACGGDTPASEGQAAGEAGPQGDVAGGTISDDMIPLAELKSQSPPLRKASDDGDDGPNGSDEDSESESEGNEGGGG